jgi:hypothetical protein
MYRKQVSYRWMAIRLLLSLTLGGCARYRANHPTNGIPPDATQLKAARDQADFNNFLHDMSHVPGGRVNSGF